MVGLGGGLRACGVASLLLCEGFFDFRDGSFWGDAVFFAEDFDGAVFDEFVGPADADDGGLDAGV